MRASACERRLPYRPFNDCDEVDHSRLAHAAKQKIVAGAGYLMPTALTGEDPLLTPE